MSRYSDERVHNEGSPFTWDDVSVYGFRSVKEADHAYRTVCGRMEKYRQVLMEAQAYLDRGDESDQRMARALRSVFYE